MADVFTQKKRSEIMSRISSKHTSPEIAVRKALYSLGFRYRLHDKKLPGKPDIVIKQAKTAIFVNGCFWHQHKGCKRKTMPKFEDFVYKNAKRGTRIIVNTNPFSNKKPQKAENGIFLYEI